MLSSERDAEFVINRCVRAVSKKILIQRRTRLEDTRFKDGQRQTVERHGRDRKKNDSIAPSKSGGLNDNDGCS